MKIYEHIFLQFILHSERHYSIYSIHPKQYLYYEFSSVKYNHTLRYINHRVVLMRWSVKHVVLFTFYSWLVTWYDSTYFYDFNNLFLLVFSAISLSFFAIKINILSFLFSSPPLVLQHSIFLLVMPPSPSLQYSLHIQLYN